MKFKVYLILLILSMLVTGCIGITQHDTQTRYNLKYDFDKGDKFCYEINTSIANQNEKNSEFVDLSVDDGGKNNIVLLSSIFKKTVSC